MRQSAREGAEGLFLQNSGLAQWAVGTALSQHRGTLRAQGVATSFVLGFTPLGAFVDTAEALACLGR